MLGFCSRQFYSAEGKVDSTVVIMVGLEVKRKVYRCWDTAYGRVGSTGKQIIGNEFNNCSLQNTYIFVGTNLYGNK